MCNSFNCDDSGKMHLNARDVESICDIFDCTNQQTGDLERKKKKKQSTKYKVSRANKVHIKMFTKKTSEVTL